MSTHTSRAQTSEEQISREWPLHWLVWNDDHTGLNRLLEQKVYDKEAHDPRGRTPLHLAVSLKHKKCAEMLLYHGANALATNRHNWSVLHESISTGDMELVSMVLAVRDRQQLDATSKDIPLMLAKLRSAPDFYIEMKWEFTSWMPFLSRLCPSDTYKIWKKGTKVRVDTSLIGFQNLQWIRGNLSFIFQITDDGASFIEINHDQRTIIEHPMQQLKDPRTQMDPYQQMASHELTVMRRMKSPIVSTIFNSQDVSFERQKSGIWGFRSDRSETINGFNAKVFSVTGLDIVTRTRVDHLPDEEKQKQKSAGISPLQGFLGMSEEETSEADIPGAGLLPGGTAVSETNEGANGTQLSMREYFTPPSDPKKYDAIGSKVDVHNRHQGLKAIVWVSEGHPLSLHDQILPIIELMSLNNAHFAKLKDFVMLQMPAGFPIKFEIPLFHLMSARVTFGNINGLCEPVPHLSLKSEKIVECHDTVATPSTGTSFGGISSVKRRHKSNSESDTGSSVDPPPILTPPINVGGDQFFPLPTEKTKDVCEINDEAFVYPTGYYVNSQYGGTGIANEEEELLQLAIRQSLIDQGLPPNASNTEEISLTEALNDETIMSTTNRQQYVNPLSAYMTTPSLAFVPDDSEDITLAIALSQLQADEDERLRKQEEEELEIVLKLSLQEK